MDARGFHFGDDYCEVATLRDGQQVRLRMLQPSDRERLQQGFARLSPESRYQRFFAAKLELSEQELRYLTEVDQIDHVAIGAERVAEGDDDGNGEGLGVARFIRIPERPDTAEAAVAVIDELQGKGLGSLLLQRLVAAARERGVQRFRCDVLTSNQAIMDILYAFVPAVTLQQGNGIVGIEIELPQIEPAQPNLELPRQSPLYRLFQLFARKGGELHRLLSRLGLG